MNLPPLHELKIGELPGLKALFSPGDSEHQGSFKNAGRWMMSKVEDKNYCYVIDGSNMFYLMKDEQAFGSPGYPQNYYLSAFGREMFERTGTFWAGTVTRKEGKAERRIGYQDYVKDAMNAASVWNDRKEPQGSVIVVIKKETYDISLSKAEDHDLAQRWLSELCCQGGASMPIHWFVVEMTQCPAREPGSCLEKLQQRDRDGKSLCRFVREDGSRAYGLHSWCEYDDVLLSDVAQRIQERISRRWSGPTAPNPLLARTRLPSPRFAPRKTFVFIISDDDRVYKDQGVRYSMFDELDKARQNAKILYKRGQLTTFVPSKQP